MKIRTITSYIAVASTLLLAGCSGGGADVKDKLGLKVSPPDEFSVVTRAPLSVPPDYTLRPPRPGEGRPNEITVRDQAKQTVFGAGDMPKAVAEKPSGSDGTFLNKLGASQADPNIRSSIDTEIKTLEEKEQPVAEKLLFWKDKKVVGKALDPVEEQKRLEAEGVNKNSSSDTTIEKRNEDILKTP